MQENGNVGLEVELPPLPGESTTVAARGKVASSSGSCHVETAVWCSVWAL